MPRSAKCSEERDTSYLPTQWLSHADARQVSDLPETGSMILSVYDHLRIC